MCARSIWQLSQIFGSGTRTVCGSVFLQGISYYLKKTGGGGGEGGNRMYSNSQKSCLNHQKDKLISSKKTQIDGTKKRMIS